ncbi:zinc finger protein ZAT4-like [Mangifera indica]|uniref:zinc finger protein ZAT4-like n=1 Tax=Mangifera indica TaxID=29780 RepID=UPI001CFAFABE|nr:zinc finger protein ZAT4-like [Mangifera indica]
MDTQRICKICNRSFANGKAMGGHMRSHLAKLPIPSKPKPSPVFTLKSSSSSSSLSNHSFKDHIQPYRSVNHDLSDVEGEAESSRNLTKRRSKRRRNPSEADPESVSSITDNFPVEEIAMCLLTLSRDKWPEEDKVKLNHHKYIGDDESDSTTTSKIFKCKTCKKGFRSHQALGGHIASYKKIKINLKGSHEDVTDLDPRVFKCPICDKVFESGQALGGHKKVHFTNSSVSYKDSSSSKSGEKFLDLNLPAPEDDTEVSQVLFDYSNKF